MVKGEAKLPRQTQHIDQKLTLSAKKVWTATTTTTVNSSNNSRATPYKIKGSSTPGSAVKRNIFLSLNWPGISLYTGISLGQPWLTTFTVYHSVWIKHFQRIFLVNCNFPLLKRNPNAARLEIKLTHRALTRWKTLAANFAAFYSIIFPKCRVSVFWYFFNL